MKLLAATALSPSPIGQMAPRPGQRTSGRFYLFFASCIFATLLIAGCAKAATNNGSDQANAKSVFPKGEIATNTDDYTGTIWLNILSKADSTFPFNVDLATYAPGSKLNWHIHPGGQILLIIKGTGYYQEKGKPVRIVHKGDVIKCPPGVEHWHAAAPNSSFAYIAITPIQKGKTIWLRPVTEKEYNSITPPTSNRMKDKTIHQTIK